MHLASSHVIGRILASRSFGPRFNLSRRFLKTMIVGIGTDIVEIDRIQELAEQHEAFLARTFAPREIEHCRGKKNPYPHFAARFAAKEAVFKAFGTGWSGDLRWTDVVVENNSAGRPSISLSGSAERYAEKLGVDTIHISLTHTLSYAGAQVVMEGSDS